MSTVFVVGSLAFGAAVARAVTRHRALWRWGPVAVALFPVESVVMTGIAGVGSRLASRRRRSERAALAAADVVTLGELMALGLRAGLAPAPALARAASWVTADLGDEVDGILRRSRIVGLPVALGSAGGHGARLYRLVSRSMESGSPLGPMLDAFVDDELDRDRARSAERARRLPVKLLFPLALLILPGFLVLVTAPALLGAVRRIAL